MADIHIADTFEPVDGTVLHDISVDLDNRDYPGIIHLIQGDYTRPILCVHLNFNYKPYSVPAGMAVNIRMKKPDKTNVYNPVLGLSEDRTTVYASITRQMSAAYGMAVAIIEICDTDGVVGSAPFVVDFDRNPVQNDDIRSSDEYRTVYELIREAESWAHGGTGSREGEETDNAMYYADVAKQYGENPYIIQNETWWKWDPDARRYVDTGLPARGRTGDKGDDGEVGPPIQILGTYDTYEALISEVQDPEIGDAYGVGTEPPLSLWIYGATGWANYGPISASLKSFAIGLEIPASGWSNGDRDSKYTRYIDVSCKQSSSRSVPIISLSKESMAVAEASGLCPTAEAFDGYIRFWAELDPSGEMSASLVLINPDMSAGGGSGYELPVATRTTLGGVKASGSLTVDEDGTAHTLTEEAATDEEVNEMLDEVFSGE